MPETPAPGSGSSGRSFGLRTAILIALGGGFVLVAAVLGLRGPPDFGTPKPAIVATPAPAPKPEDVAPSFDVVRVNPRGDTVIAGRAAPGAEVILRQDGKEIGRTHADSRGEWVFLPSEPLPSGARELTLSARTANGPEIAGAGSVVLVVPERLPPGSLATANLPPGPVAVLSDSTGAPRMLQGATAGKTPGKLGLEAVEYDNQGQLRFAGTAPPGAHVRIQIDNRPAGDAVADAHGVWSLVPPASVEPGAHRLRLDQIGPDGKVAVHAEYPFQRESIGEKELAEGNVIVRPGNNLWLLARSLYGHGARYTVIYEANRAKVTNPGKIYPGQILTLPPSAGEPASPDSGSLKPGTAPSSSSRSR